MKKYNTYLFITLLLLFCAISQDMRAQNAEVELEKRIERAKELYVNANYVAAEKEFSQIIEIREDRESDAYRIFSLLKLKRANAKDEVTLFEKRYPFAVELPRMKFMLSEILFENEEYADALKIMDELYIGDLYAKDQVHYQFNRSYCNMRVGNNSEALRGFMTILTLPVNKFTSASTYYTGYIHYLNQDFNVAIDNFSKLIGDVTYSKLSNYYLIESHFMLRDYRYVVENGPKVHQLLDGEYKMQIERILSEAYFELDMPQDARRYMDMYQKDMKNLSRKDYYYSGVLSSSLDSYHAAIESFNKVLTVNDSLSQSAYYHLGSCYIQTKSKYDALYAFRAASELSFDRGIKEDAMFNYAKLAFDLNSDISVFDTYLQEFPNSGNSDEIHNYIATSFLLRKDYASAIEALGKIKKLTPGMTQNLQKAAFFRAMQLIESGSYRASIPILELSIKNGSYNQPLNNLAQFWLAESCYRNNQYKRAVSINQTLIKSSSFRATAEYVDAMYNMAYAYFKNGEFTNAVEWFNQYLELSGQRAPYRQDAVIRSGDCYFMIKDYSRAAETFEQAVFSNTNKNDIYAEYYAALAHGLLGNSSKKIEILEGIRVRKPASKLYSEAVYELGRTYVNLDKYTEAKKCFNELTSGTKDNGYYAKSLIELGMISANQSDSESAIRYYKTVIERFPYSEEAESAMSGLENIYQMQNRTQEFLSYLDQIGMSSVKTMDEKELMLFNAAEQAFLAGNYTSALNTLQSYTKQYPQGQKVSQAYYYIAEAHNKIGDHEKAADAYYQVMETGDGAHAELATLNYARLSYQLMRYSNATRAYQTLYEVAKLDNNKFEALVGMMRSFYMNKEYHDAAREAQRVLQSSRGQQQLTLEANYIIAKSKLAIGERESALPILKELSKDSDTKEGAEALYLLILDAYDSGDFDSVESMVYALADKGTSQLYWMAKCYIVLGDSFAERDELESARATFNSILNEYKPQGESDDVIEQVNMRIKKL